MRSSDRMRVGSVLSDARHRHRCEICDLAELPSSVPLTRVAHDAESPAEAGALGAVLPSVQRSPGTVLLRRMLCSTAERAASNRTCILTGRSATRSSSGEAGEPAFTVVSH